VADPEVEEAFSRSLLAPAAVVIVDAARLYAESGRS